jgi:hypothetical protein
MAPKGLKSYLTENTLLLLTNIKLLMLYNKMLMPDYCENHREYI